MYQQGSSPGHRGMGLTAAARAARLRLPADPGRVGLRRAARVALVMPAAFAFAKLVIGDAQVMTFVAFGCFALLVMAHFGGPRRPRAAAYVTTTLVGATLVTLGTLASPIAWVAALGMLLVGFWIQFVGVFGSYVAAAQTALLLAFVLAVSIPAPPAAVGARLLGWFIAGAVSTLAGVFLWPRFERLALRYQAADACRALAELVRAQRGKPAPVDLSPHRQAALEAVEAVRKAYAATPLRPAGPTRRDRAAVELLTELERTLEFVTRLFPPQLPASHPCLEEGDKLAAAVVRTLQASADVLTGGAPPDLLTLQAAGRAHRQALDRWAADALRAGRSPEDVLAGLEVDHALRVVAYLALAIGSNAVIAAGGRLGAELRLPAGTPRHEGPTGVGIRVARTVRTHLEPTSSVLHNSLRVALGLALAVLLARLLRLDHAFWVVLATLSVLRSNALATGRTTLQALAGTVAGFGVGAIFIGIAGANSAVFWAALPVTVFLAAYATSAIGFVAGQATFTVVVIVLFNLIAPAGWRIGLVRIEDVAVGAGISVVAGLLLWPHGARRELRLAVAGLYRAVTVFLARAFTRVLEGGAPEDASRARSLAVQARDRAGEAFDQFLQERGAKPLAPEAAAFLVASGTHILMIGDLLNVFAEMGYQAQGCSEGVTALQAQTQVLVATFLWLADRLGAPSAAGPQERVAEDVLREAALTCLRRWKEDPAGDRAAIAVVVAGEWLQQLGALATDLEEPVAAAVEAARVPWWR
jgi:uncharacterized membrane protein YccC